MLQTENRLNDQKKSTKLENTILKLKVKNHPGVMSHICGLFARRAFNMEKILCLPIGNGKESMIYLMVTAAHNMDQIIKQLLKLEDVIEVSIEKTKIELFDDIEMLLHKELAVTSGNVVG